MGIRGFQPLSGGVSAAPATALPLYEQPNLAAAQQPLQFRDVVVVGSATFHHAAAESVISVQAPGQGGVFPLRGALEDDRRRTGGGAEKRPEVGPEGIASAAAAAGARARQEVLGRVGHVGGSTCQDCGNQAKKDCQFRRCRTCCRSRAFECATHVRSTWVPAARRRERQQSEAAFAAAVTAAATAGGGGSAGLFGSATAEQQQEQQRHPEEEAKGSKRARVTALAVSHGSTSANSSDINLSFRSGLPGQVRTQAVFKCVRVSPIDDGDVEYAYQAVVKIGGHVFKGVLYDQGSDTGELPEFSDLQLSGHNLNVNTTSSIMDHIHGYGGASGSGFIDGAGYVAGNSVN
ncbi:protein LATERAL ROOT PRIMORDIUM 1-like isoform X2 [Nymphaea colorata]|uniref:protein LATERAL ROOT PRIMORDIUM 1-like isoform X2 n=1 Tax=Nymphaea colorata TaxID=210225 RepID=UPI00129E5993|nr:protein LATERAL ROOT PRIMORDIUM 1-like isoform X2 [Nymphaea colorata]